MDDQNHLRSTNWFQTWMGSIALKKLKEREANATGSPTTQPKPTSTTPTKEQVKQDEKKQDEKKDKSFFGNLFKKKTDDNQKPTLEGVASLKIFAKNTILFRRMSRELKLINKGFTKFAKLEGVKVVTKPSAASKLAGLFKQNEVDKELKKAKKSDTKKDKKKKKKGFFKNVLDSIIDGLITIVAGIAFALFMNKDAILGIIESLGGIEGIISMGIEAFKTAFNDFFGSTDWGKAFVEEASKLIEFLSFGLITKDDAAKALNVIGDFISPVTSRIGEFLSGVGNWIADKLKGFGRSLDQNVLGIQPSATRPGEKEKPIDPYAGAAEQLEALNSDIDQLKAKRNKLKELIAKREEDRRGGKKVEQITPPPPQQPASYRSKKSVFAPTEAPKPAVVSAPTPTPAAPAPTPTVAKTEAPKGTLDTLTKKADAGVDTSKFNPEFENRVVAMAAAFKQETGKMLLITSGYRSNEKQKELYDADLAKNNGKPSGKVAQPMAPLGSGAGSVHMKGFGIDINSKEPEGLNVLAGPRDKSKGWLEKFGLIRNVKGEDWHVTIGGAPPTPDDATVTSKSGATVDPATGQQKGEGLNVGKSSTELAVEQRNQSKPKTPTVINAGVTNNTVVESKQLRKEVPA
jgi:LAS superfamily LD-carboxypeptidase LdcB